MHRQTLIAYSLFLLTSLTGNLSAQWEISQSREANRLGTTVKSTVELDASGNSQSSELVFFIDGNKVWTGALISSETNLHSITSIETQATDPMGRLRTQKMRFWNIRKGTGMKNKSILLFSFSYPDLRSISKLEGQTLAATTRSRKGSSESHLFTLDKCAESLDTIEGAIKRLGLGIYLR